MGRKPAEHGTLSRYMNHRCRCDACRAAWRSYYEANKEREKKRVQDWRKANPDKRKAQSVRYREKYRVELRARNLAYYYARMESDPEAVRKYRREWAKTEKGALTGRLARHNRRGAKTDPEYAAILLRDPCSYCGAPGGEIDHITPISQGGDGHWSNLTSACRPCNASKNDRPLLEFVAA